MQFKLLSVIFISIALFSCGGKEKDKLTNAQKCEEPKNQKNNRKPDLLANVPFRKTPVVDTTNFDNFNGENPLSEKVISKLQLRKIEPDYETFHSRYRLALSTAVDMVVVTMAIEHEMKTFLITYRKEDYRMIDKLMIAYDEIAESMSRTEGKIGTDEVVVTDYNYWGEEPSIEIERYRIEKSGKFKAIN